MSLHTTIQKEIAGRLVTLPGRNYYLAVLPRDPTEPVEVEIVQVKRTGAAVVEAYGNFTEADARKFVRDFNAERLDVFGRFWI